uniref:Uncharacterized protein n=1 Tax=Arundo donax TaxID=35708 RepID=A0A0A9E3W4_ARUDO
MRRRPRSSTRELAQAHARQRQPSAHELAGAHARQWWISLPPLSPRLHRIGGWELGGGLQSLCGDGACALSDGPRSSHAGATGALALVERQSRRWSRCRWRWRRLLASSRTPASSSSSATSLPPPPAGVTGHP